jgi:hypothetical protein
VSFTDISASKILNIELIDAMLAQDPNPYGVRWNDDSDDPIVNAFLAEENKSIMINWYSKNEFFIHFKVYTNNGSLLSVMINDIDTICFMFSVTICSITDAKNTQMIKLWLKKSCGNITIENATSVLIDD